MARVNDMASFLTMMDVSGDVVVDALFICFFFRLGIRL